MSTYKGHPTNSSLLIGEGIPNFKTITPKQIHREIPLLIQDLNQALNEDLIFGAGLDVIEKEPPSVDNPLLKNEKAFLSPHSAVFTEECLSRMGIETVQNIIDFFDNKLEKSKIVKIS